MILKSRCKDKGAMRKVEEEVVITVKISFSQPIPKNLSPNASRQCFSKCKFFTQKAC